MKKLVATLCLVTVTVSSMAADYGLKRGTPTLKSAGSLAFGPNDVLFVGDTKSAAVFAIGTGDLEGDASKVNFQIDDFATAAADVAGGKATINDLAVNPNTGHVFASVTTSDGPAILKVDGAGKMTRLDLEEIPFSKVDLANAPEDKVTGEGRRKRNNRGDTITDLAFYEGKLMVSGLQTTGSPSTVREIAFPFAGNDKGVGVQIFHAAHGRDENYSAMRTFVPLVIDGEPSLLAAYVCTPLVKIPLKELESAGEQIKATTVAELGNRNRPLDMISYTKDGGEYLLLTNSARGVMKITTSGLSSNKGLSERVSGGGTAGQTYDTIDELKGTVQMDKLNATHAVVLVENEQSQTLRSVELP